MHLTQSLPPFLIFCRYGYSWKAAEAEKNLLRTHTTAVSSRMLYELAQRGFKPARYFSVDRVFRNEAIDRTHLAEFHQIEGEWVCVCWGVGVHAPGCEFHQITGGSSLEFDRRPAG